MLYVNDIEGFDFNDVPIDTFWNTGSEPEHKMHRIHSYPAKFPAFITTKALEFAYANGLDVQKIGDIFCGCGTTAFESRRNGIDFWGCDINPVATLIASVKSKKYSKSSLENHLERVINKYQRSKIPQAYSRAPERMRYWYSEDIFNELYTLKRCITLTLEGSPKYLNFFYCAFSNILKQTSFWLTKSIKPQVDPHKSPADVLHSFVAQCKSMIAANDEVGVSQSTKTAIRTKNFLSSRIKPPKVDMIVTSPPYVTSYEYADLHQLSSMWLGYTNDYRSLRKGSIGSVYQSVDEGILTNGLNSTGSRIVEELADVYRSKARAVSSYYVDMQNVAKKAFPMLNKNGLALFVIGNTEYKGVRIDNAKHLSESLLSAGFRDVAVTKRRITKKILTPYRDEKGKFSSDSSGRKVYSEEFIIVGRK